MLTENVKRVVKETAPLLEKEGEAITKSFYAQLFEAHPELTNVFNMVNQKTGTQAEALANAVFAYASHIDELDKLSAFVERTAHKHASLSVQPEHYPIVGTFLLKAIQDHFSLEDDHEILTSWAVAYQGLADIFVNTEQAIYTANATSPGGWSDFRDFTITNIVDETPAVKSFVLHPADGGQVITAKPGQYVGVKLELGDGQSCIRQYSLSSPGPQTRNDQQSYRITVKAEAHMKDQPGTGSNHLHQLAIGDRLALLPPTGVFTLQPDDPRPPVFIAGGIGVTPLLAMASELANRSPEILTASTFIHACVNQEQQPLRTELEQLHQQFDMEYLVHCDQATSGVDGFVTAETVKSWLPETDRPVYLCGPTAFMDKITEILIIHGFANEDIKTETFGPTLR